MFSQDTKASRQRTAFVGGFIFTFAVLFIPSVAIDLGAWIANEVKMPLGALMLIEAGAYLPVALLFGLIAADDVGR